MTENIIKKIPWWKITAPMFPLGVIDWLLSKFLYNIYKINVENGITDSFPTSRTFYIFMISNLLIILVYLVVSVFGLLLEEKIKKLKLFPKTETATERAT